MNAVIRFTLLSGLFLIALNVGNVFGHKNLDEFLAFKSQADILKCNICKNIVFSPSVWQEKVGSSLLAQLKHCHELFKEQKGSPNFHAAMFACHEFARDNHARNILDSISASSAVGDAHCSSFC